MTSFLENTLAAALKKQKDDLSGQTSLFGMGDEGDDSFDEAPPLVDVEPFLEEESLSLEKQVLGLYVSGHPLDKYTEQINRFSSINLSHIVEIEDGMSITIGGMTSGVRVIVTKKVTDLPYLC